MIIQGLQKHSLIDYPDKISCVIFTAGCNFRCKFCHNKDLVLKNLPEIPEEKILEFLEKRKKWLDAVVITGGEPTLHNDLTEFIKKIKDLNYLVKLDTNGSNPDQIKKSLPYIDYIAMDVKTSLENYEKVTNYNEIENIKQSIDIIKNSNTSYEFRATVLKEVFDKKDAENVSKLLKNAKTFILQKFQPKNTLDPEYLNKKPYSNEEMQQMKKILEKHIQKVIIR